MGKEIAVMEAMKAIDFAVCEIIKNLIFSIIYLFLLIIKGLYFNIRELIVKCLFKVMVSIKLSFILSLFE